MPEPVFIQHIGQFLHELEADDIILLIDQNVNTLYEMEFDEFDRIVVPSGENSKNLKLVEEIIEILLEKELHRDSLLVGIGGGVVTDIAGFVASIYKRGMRFGFIPTTLLAMCDAAVGGKNGVNLAGFKNVAGTFSNPEFIAVYTGFLNTLPPEEFANGMAEMIKHALISGEDFVSFLEGHADQILNREDGVLREMISRSVNIKQSVTEADMYDNDSRHILNLGHTLAHAFELDSGLSHGFCVAAGICLDSEIALNMGLTDKETVRRIFGLFEKFQLPVSMKFRTDNIIQKISGDKKIRSGKIRYILPVVPGDCRILKFSIEELRGHLQRIENE